MNQRTPQNQIVTVINQTSARECSSLLGHEQHTQVIESSRDQLDFAFELITSEHLSEQVTGVEMLYSLGHDGDSEAAYLLSEVALSSREVVTHLTLHADSLLAWAAELGHAEARFSLAMRDLNDSDKKRQDSAFALLAELAHEGCKEAISFVRSMGHDLT
jgi:hypothetical protein